MPDPDARLDLGALMEGKASNPANWPTPFTDDGAATLNWVEAEPGTLRTHCAGRPIEMLRYVARRLLLMIPTLFIISAVVYFIIDLPPGDCVTAQVEELVSRGDADALKRADELAPSSTASTSRNGSFADTSTGSKAACSTGTSA